LYDLSSQLPYPELIEPAVAMKIGEHHRIARIGREDWQKVALTCAIPADTLIDMIMEMAGSFPSAIESAHSQAIFDGLADNVIAPLAQQLMQHVHERIASIKSVGAKRRRR